jgi:hypothetical protein
MYWVVPEKIHTPPVEEISAVRKGISDISKCIRTSKRGRGLISNFLCGGRGMDVFWNDSELWQASCKHSKLAKHASLGPYTAQGVGLYSRIRRGLYSGGFMFK